MSTFKRVPLLNGPSKNNCEFLLPRVTPEAGENVALTIPRSTKLYLCPTGIATEDSKGITMLIGFVLDNKIVLLTSRGSKVNPDVLVITVLLLSSAGSTSKFKSLVFQSKPAPARSE